MQDLLPLEREFDERVQSGHKYMRHQKASKSMVKKFELAVQDAKVILEEVRT